jgi:hypothetical protein
LDIHKNKNMDTKYPNHPNRAIIKQDVIEGWKQETSAITISYLLMPHCGIQIAEY